LQKGQAGVHEGDAARPVCTAGLEQRISRHLAFN